MNPNQSCRKRNLALLAKQYGTVAAFARAVNMNRTFLSDLLKGRREISEKTSRKIESTLGLGEGFMISQDNLGDIGLHTSFPLIHVQDALRQVIEAMKHENQDPERISHTDILDLSLEYIVTRASFKESMNKLASKGALKEGKKD